jgi:DNA ligase-1
MITKPLLAATLEDILTLQFPLLATPKLDGIRCLRIGPKAVSRKFIDIPNHHIREWLIANIPDGMDGEIVCPGKTFNETQSLVMSEDGTPEFVYFIFDYVRYNIKAPYSERCDDLSEWMRSAGSMVNVIVLIPTLITSLEELVAYEALNIEQGFEGTMLRKPEGAYKCGRSTLKECILLKWKRMETAEAFVIGFVEQMENQNVKTKDNLGNSKRSKKKEHMVPKGTLGTLLVQDVDTGRPFGVGTGFSDELRQWIWDNQSTYIGKTLTYQYQPHGTKDKPRIPSFKGFRDTRDISE